MSNNIIKDVSLAVMAIDVLTSPTPGSAIRKILIVFCPVATLILTGIGGAFAEELGVGHAYMEFAIRFMASWFIVGIPLTFRFFMDPENYNVVGRGYLYMFIVTLLLYAF